MKLLVNDIPYIKTTAFNKTTITLCLGHTYTEQPPGSTTDKTSRMTPGMSNSVGIYGSNTDSLRYDYGV